MTRESARLIYQIVIEECGAPADMANDFEHHAVEDKWTEWRFCGWLGFGGKLWNGRGIVPHYVNCYREDVMPDRTRMIERANARLAEVAP